MSKRIALSICAVIALAPALRLFPTGTAQLAGRAAWTAASAIQRAAAAV